MRFLISSALLALLSAAVVGATDVAISPSSAKPKLFAPEANWPAGSDASPAFTPDGQTVFFTHAVGAARTIMVSYLRASVWSKPETAPFSGTWRDIEPAMAPDGSYLVFVSNRPESAGGTPLTGFFGGVSRPGAGGNIWRVNRENQGWGAPLRLPAIVNSNSAIYSPALVRDGSLYFNQPDPITRKSHIYRSQWTGDGFEAPAPLSISHGEIADFDAAVAPDESFMVFSSGRPPAPTGHAVLFVTFSKNRHWTTPKAVEPVTDGLEARLSPDLKTLYFSADTPTEGLPTSADVPSRIFQRPMTP